MKIVWHSQIWKGLGVLPRMHGPHLENHCPRQFCLVPNINCRPVTSIPGSLLNSGLWVSGTSLVSLPSQSFFLIVPHLSEEQGSPCPFLISPNSLNASSFSPQTTFSSYSCPKWGHRSQLHGRIHPNLGLYPGFLPWVRVIQQKAFNKYLSCGQMCEKCLKCWFGWQETDSFHLKFPSEILTSSSLHISFSLYVSTYFI